MKLSVITVNLNNKVGLQKTVDSIRKQTYNNIEYLIIDGGSTDGSLDVINANNDIISQWISEPDLGIYNAMNKGLKLATGDYIGFMNSGDYFIDDVVSRVFAKPQTADILYGDQYFIRNGGVKQLKTKPVKLTLYDFFWGSLYHQSSFVRKELFDNESYNEQLRINADAEFFIKRIVVENCSTHHLGFPVACYDTTGLSSSDKAGEIIKEERKYLHSRYFNEMSVPDYYQLREYKNSALAQYIPELNKTDRFEVYVSRLVALLLKLYKVFK